MKGHFGKYLVILNISRINSTILQPIRGNFIALLKRFLIM